MKRTLMAVSVLALLGSVGTGGAWSSAFLTFSGTQARPGAVVLVQTGGRGALTNIPTSEPIRVFLAPASEVERIRSPGDSRLVPVGRLRVDKDGNGFLRFIVPSVPAGDYTTFMYCAACALHSSGGRALFPTGPFPGSFIVLGSGDGIPLLLIALGAGGGVLLLAVAIGLMMRRRGTALRGHRVLSSRRST